MPIAGFFFVAVAFAIYAGLIFGISQVFSSDADLAPTPLGMILSALPFVVGISLIYDVWAGILSAPDRTLDRISVITRYRRGAVIQGVSVAVVMTLVILGSMVSAKSDGSQENSWVLSALALDVGLFAPVYLAGRAKAWLVGFLKDQPQSDAHAYWEEVRARRKRRDEDE